MTAIYNRLGLLILLFSLLFAACAPTAAEPGPGLAAEESPLPELPLAVEATPTLSSLERYYVPTYYSPFYGQVIEDSKSENGLRIYASIPSENWAPVLEIFQNHYPWINVITLELEASEAFGRYSQEMESDARTADIVISSDVIAWQHFTEQGQVLTYRSQEEAYLPSWSKAGAGIYTASIDPLLIIYNKQMLDRAPVSMLYLSTLARAFTAKYTSTIAVHDVTLSPNGFVANWFWIRNQGEAGWNILKAVGVTAPVFKNSDRQIVEDVGTGVNYMAYFVSSLAVLPRLSEYPDLGWSYMQDGQPIALQNVAITQANASPNSAKLMLDFLLSQEGQLALSMGGLTPYRTDVLRLSPLHLEKISGIVGQEKLIFLLYEPRLDNPGSVADFSRRWEAALRPPEVLQAESTPEN